MYRRLSVGQQRRSSQPKKLSLVLESEEKISKSNGEGKKSFIPRPKTVRASSVDRDDRRSSARLPSAPLGIRSGDRNSYECFQRASDLRARSTENLFTPKYATKSPAVASRQTTGSKSVRKDTRPLNDKGYQNVELINVQQYLLKEKILDEDEVREVRNPMTTKLFVTVMNALLTKMFPTSTVNLSNYSEVIPSLMRILKYPGIVTRSWLITANSTHSWPNVLGLLSWLTHFLSVFSSDLEYITDANNDDDEMVIMDKDKIKKLQAYFSKRYINWCEEDGDLSSSFEEQFVDELFLDIDKTLDEQIMKVRSEVEALENLKRQVLDSKEFVTEEEIKDLKLEKEKKRKMCSSLQERNIILQNKLEKCRREKQLLRNEINKYEQTLADDNSTSICEMEDLTDLESQANSIRNITELKVNQITDISNQCYSADITIARLQGKMDELKLRLESLVEEILSKYIDKSMFQFSLNSNNDDNSEVMTKLFSYLEDLSKSMKKAIEDSEEEERKWESKRSEIEENIKFVEEEIRKEMTMVEQLEFELKELNISNAALERKVQSETEDNKEKLAALDQNIDKLKNDILCKEKDLKFLEETKKEMEEKYRRILEKMVDMYEQFVEKCRKDVENVFK